MDITLSKGLFPLGLAGDLAFCNRIKERAILLNNIKACRHTLILSPRRYGKTSLATQVLEEHSIPHANVDFLLASDESKVEEYILAGVSRLATQLLPLHKKALQQLQKFMASLKPSITFSHEGVRIDFTPGKKLKQNILDALLGLDKLAAAQKKQIVFLMDEFQQIADLKDHETLEAAIRHAAERAKNTTYIFSGSHRHILADMFDSKERPLYHLCEHMNLSRIHAADYKPFLQKLAKKQWKINLDEIALNTILELTQRHPYYVNLLCGRLWRETKAPPATEIEATWQILVAEERNRLADELSILSPNQRAVLVTIAMQPTAQPTSRIFLAQTKLPAASYNQALNVLEKKDLLYRDDDNLLRPLNPVVEYMIRAKH